LMRRAVAAVHDCFEQHLTFDITVDDGQPITGYHKTIHVSDAD
jgi:hypothetical protein